MPWYTFIRGRAFVCISALIGVVAVIVAFRQKEDRKGKSLDKMMEALNKPTVHIKEREKVVQTIEEMISDGKERLQVIADFDRTLSKHSSNGKECDTCHNAIERSERLSEAYKAKAKATKDKYYAIELDPHLTIQEKYPFMVEWWEKAHDLLVQCNLNQNMVKQIVGEANIVLRDHSDWMFQQLNKHNVPLLIFSAGIGDIIEETLKLHSTIYDNMKIVSNYMDFNLQGHLIGFKGDMIHIFNKNEGAIQDSDYFANLSHRDNIVLLGDSLGDLSMAEGANAKIVLKIGFLNDKVDQLLPKYLDAYDIVLVHDETLDIPTAILKEMF